MTLDDEQARKMRAQILRKQILEINELAKTNEDQRKSETDDPSPRERLRQLEKKVKKKKKET